MIIFSLWLANITQIKHTLQAGFSFWFLHCSTSKPKKKPNKKIEINKGELQKENPYKQATEKQKHWLKKLSGKLDHSPKYK